MQEDLETALSPVLAASGLELVDVHRGPRQVKVVVDRVGGVDIDALAEVTSRVSRVLDGLDLFPGRYTLEVTSPGLERPLRTPDHFARAIGETISVRARADGGAVVKVRGRLVASDDRKFVVEGPEVPGGSQAILFEALDRARTVFEWAPAPKPSRRPSAKASHQASQEPSRSISPGATRPRRSGTHALGSGVR